MALRWDFVDLIDRLQSSLLSAENELRVEQAVHGLDVRDERALQALLAERLGAFYSVRGRCIIHRPLEEIDASAAVAMLC